MLTNPISITNDTTTDLPATATLDADTVPAIPPMPPSPKAEPFHPATTVPASATAPTPREHAYTLHLQGYRSPAIAAHLHVPERTIRYWIQRVNQDLNALPALDTLDPFDTLTDADQPDPQAGESRDPTQPTPLSPSPPCKLSVRSPSNVTVPAPPPPGRCTTSCVPPSTPSSHASANASSSTPNTLMTMTTSPCRR